MAGENEGHPEATTSPVAFRLGPPTTIDPSLVPKLLEPFATPEMLVDGIANIAVAGGSLRLTFYAERQPISDTEAQLVRVVVGRIALSPQSAHFVALTLRAVLDQLAADGTISSFPAVKMT